MKMTALGRQLAATMAGSGATDKSRLELGNKLSKLWRTRYLSKRSILSQWRAGAANLLGAYSSCLHDATLFAIALSLAASATAETAVPWRVVGPAKRS